MGNSLFHVRGLGDAVVDDLRSDAPRSAALLRHFVLWLAAAVAHELRHELGVELRLLWGFAALSLLNIAFARMPSFASHPHAVRMISSCVAILGWAGLVGATGGVSSPFLAGLWFEVVASGLVVTPRGSLVISLCAACLVWVQQIYVGFSGLVYVQLWVQTALLSVTGLLVYAATRAWRTKRDLLDLQLHILKSRLRDIEAHLEGGRRLSQVGKNAARSLHNMKSTLHSLRGFVELLKVPTSTLSYYDEAVAGLCLATSRLEEITHGLLSPRLASHPSQKHETTEVNAIIADVIAQVARVHQGVRWTRPLVGETPAITLSAHALREVLMVVTENAAEAAGSGGEVKVSVNVDDVQVEVMVRDSGPGVTHDQRARLFTVGTTTKHSGHGFGLFLARELLEASGGCLMAGSSQEKGGAFSIRVPRLKPGP